MDQGFTPSEIDPCLYLKENMVLLTYVDDCIIISPSRDSIDRLISSMQSGPENFKLTDEGGVNKFLGVEITHLDDNSFELSQPFLIDRILNFLGNPNPNPNPKDSWIKGSPLQRLIPVCTSRRTWSS